MTAGTENRRFRTENSNLARRRLVAWLGIGKFMANSVPMKEQTVAPTTFAELAYSVVAAGLILEPQSCKNSVAS